MRAEHSGDAPGGPVPLAGGAEGWIELRAADGHALRAWRAAPGAVRPPRGALVILPEIFGVNAHIQAVCARHAEQGWLALAPSLFDRAEPGVALGYGADDVARGRQLKDRMDDPRSLLDVQAAIDHAREQGLRVAVIGFCWGGTLAWLAAARLEGLVASVAYYGTQIAGYLDDAPGVPVLLHFGEQDPRIPPPHVDAIAGAHPGVALHRYPTGHGFNCEARAAYHAASAELAGQRTHAFLNEAIPC